MKYETEGVVEWFGGKVQTVAQGGKSFDIAFVSPARMHKASFAVRFLVILSVWP